MTKNIKNRKIHSRDVMMVKINRENGELIKAINEYLGVKFFSDVVKCCKIHYYQTEYDNMEFNVEHYSIIHSKLTSKRNITRKDINKIKKVIEYVPSTNNPFVNRCSCEFCDISRCY